MKKPSDPTLQEPVRQPREGGSEHEVAELTADDRGRYVDCNERACILLGYSRDEILALSVWDLTPEGSEIEGLQMWQEFIAVGVQAGVYQLVTKGGVPIEVEFRAVANASPGRHVSHLKLVDQRRTLFPR